MTPHVRLEPMTGAELDAWAVRSVAGFAAQQVASGSQPHVEAAASAEKTFAELLPDGSVTPSHHFWCVREVGAGHRTVGHVWLRVRPVPGEVEGYVYDVELVPDARGRGLGRATMRATEEAARELGATVMRLNVFGHNVSAIRLYESLGYAVAIVSLHRRLGDQAGPDASAGPRVELRDMTAGEYVVFRPRFEAEHAVDVAEAWAMPTADARRRAADDLAAWLPRGRLSEGHLLWTAYDGEEPVGPVWLHLQERSDGLHAFGFQLEVPDQLDGESHGSAVVETVLRACRERGVVALGLSVLGSDKGARRTYEDAGFELTAQTMVRQL